MGCLRTFLPLVLLESWQFVLLVLLLSLLLLLWLFAEVYQVPSMVAGAVVCAEEWMGHGGVHEEIPLCAAFVMNRHDKKHAKERR